MSVRTPVYVLAATAIGVAGLLFAAYKVPEMGVSPGPKTAAADCTQCPDMVVVPAGAFAMGSPPSELYRGAETQHRVTIASPFALGKYEVTFEQWEACLADGGCGGFVPDDHGWGRGDRPVIGVSWEDAKAYTAWLSGKTGKRYRLPSEAEWEYAARAGATTPFSFGATITTRQANYDGGTGYGNGPAGVNRGKTTPVGSFPANAFGLHDMHGNVWEWVEDCWSDEYSAATPANGAPFLGANCEGRVMRGGSWEDYPGDVRAAARIGSNKGDQTWSDGFRVARAAE
jgi:formylglycine-generating enzyme required for sulfatase activity